MPIIKQKWIFLVFETFRLGKCKPTKRIEAFSTLKKAETRKDYLNFYWKGKMKDQERALKEYPNRKKITFKIWVERKELK